MRGKKTEVKKRTRYVWDGQEEEGGEKQNGEG